MSIEELRENYAQLPLENLLTLSKDVNGFQKEAIALLQAELIKRGEVNAALEITTQVVAKRFRFTDTDLFSFVLKQRRSGYSEREIDQLLQNKFELDEAAIDVLKAKLFDKGKENLFIGVGLIVIPLIFGLIMFSLGGYVVGAAVIVLIAMGAWRTDKGYKQIRKVERTNS